MLKCIIKIARKTPNYYKDISRSDNYVKIGATGFEPVALIEKAHEIKAFYFLCCISCCINHRNDHLRC